jgi:hypothetical protein
MESELKNTVIRFILSPILAAIGSSENTLLIRIKNGAPGGCVTCSPYEAAASSPQSQKDTEGWTVDTKEARAIRKTITPIVQ